MSQSEVGKDAEEYTVIMYGGKLPETDFHQCYDFTVSLLRKDSNAWCDFAHGGDCSYAGIYQPPLPFQSNRYGGFFAFANYLKLWRFLQLPIKSTVGEIKAKAMELCAMSIDEIYAFQMETKKGKKANKKVPGVSEDDEGEVWDEGRGLLRRLQRKRVSNGSSSGCGCWCQR